MKIHSLIYLLVAGTLSACTTPIDPIEPQPGVHQVPVPGKTAIFVPISISTAVIEKLANDNFPDGKLHSGNGKEGNSVTYTYQVSQEGSDKGSPFQ